MQRFVRVLLMFAVCVSVGACATTWHKPEISLVDARLTGGNLQQQNISLQLRVKNPNDIDIGVEALSFDLIVGDERFANGVSMAPVTIPRQSEGVVSVQTKIHGLALLARLPKLVAPDGLLHYRLRGEALVRDYGRAPFDHPGTIDPAKLHFGGLHLPSQVKPVTH